MGFSLSISNFWLLNERYLLERNTKLTYYRVELRTKPNFYSNQRVKIHTNNVRGTSAILL